MNWWRGKDPVGDFNTQGQEKCWHCGDWFPEAWIMTHADKCPKNPANQEGSDD